MRVSGILRLQFALGIRGIGSMLYRRTSSVVSPAGQQRIPHVKRLSRDYSASAIRRFDNAIESAGYEVTLYRQLRSGVACTCHNDPDILDEDGNLDPEILDRLVQPDWGNDRVLGVETYAESLEPKPDSWIGSDADFDKHLGSLDSETDSTDGQEEGIEPEDIEASIPQTNMRTLSAFSSNCPVCGRIGLVGGYSVAGGVRFVFDAQTLTGLDGCVVNHTTSPHRIENPGKGSARFRTPVFTLPRRAVSVQTLRLMNGYDPVPYTSISYERAIPMGTQYSMSGKNSLLDVLEPSTGNIKVCPCDGKPGWLNVEYVANEVTHMEIQLRTRLDPIRFDITNFSRVYSPRSINDVDPLTFAAPSYVGRILRGDVFYERVSSLLWIVTSVEGVKSADRGIGVTGSASRVKTVREPFSLYNPYLNTPQVGLNV